MAISRPTYRRLNWATLPHLGLAAAIMCFAMSVSVSTWAAVVNGPMVTTTDAPLSYDATGTLTTSEAWTNNSPPPVEGPWFDIPAMVPGPADGLGAYWKFSVRESAAQFNGNKAVKARLWVKGEHIRVPPVGHGEAKNTLAEIGSEGKDVAKNGKVDMSTWGGQPHGAHFDYYGVVGTDITYTVIGATATLGGKVDVIARHSESVPAEFRNWSKTVDGFASVSAEINPRGSTVSYDATTQTLMFQPGLIDVLDSQGGLSRTVEPQFASDHLLGANFSISPLTLLGVESDGRYRFSGGEVRVDGAEGAASFSASFDEYLVGNTSSPQYVDSFAALTRGDTSESVDTDVPTFLEAFNQAHVLQRQLSNTSLEDHIMSLSFLTSPGLNLAQLTNGFTQSAMFIPADIMIGGMSHVAEPHHELPGDYNNDGYVDGLDYYEWRGEFGNPAGPADGNGNGITDAADYVVWRKNAGADVVTTIGQLSANGIAVPEPSILLLAIVGLCLTCSGRQLRSAEILKLNERRRGMCRPESLRSSGKPFAGPHKG